LERSQRLPKPRPPHPPPNDARVRPLADGQAVGVIAHIPQKRVLTLIQLLATRHKVLLAKRLAAKGGTKPSGSDRANPGHGGPKRANLTVRRSNDRRGR